MFLHFFPVISTFLMNVLSIDSFKFSLVFIRWTFDSLFQAQVHLLGNIVIWYSGTISVIVYVTLLTFYLMRRKRQCFDIPEEEWEKFVNNAYVLLAGYLLHFLPFLFVERTLFLHHYLPAFIFKVLLTAATIDHLYYLIRYVVCNLKSFYYYCLHK